MVTLLESGPRSQIELCGVISKTNGNMVMAIDNLTKHGLVIREESMKDRRVKMVVLTETGRKVIASLVEHHDQAAHKALSALNENQLDALTEIAQALAGSGKCLD